MRLVPLTIICLTVVFAGCKDDQKFNTADGGDDTDSETGTDTSVCWDGDYTITSDAGLGEMELYSCVTGDLMVENSDLVDVVLPSIEWIGGSLSINGNDALMSVSGLAALSSIGGELSIVNNNVLLTLDGLGGIPTAPDGLNVKDNNDLTNLDALAGLGGAVEQLAINNNAVLSSIAGISGITSVGEGDLVVASSPALTSLDGLAGIGSMAGELFVVNNNTLPYCEVCTFLDQLSEGPTDSTVDTNLDDSCWSGSALSCP